MINPGFTRTVLKNAKANLLFVLAFFINVWPAFPQEISVTDFSSRFKIRRTIGVTDKSPLITICAVGDLMMSSWIIDVVKENGVDFPFDSTRFLLKKGDITIANLEAPLTETGSAYKDKTFTFKVPPSFIDGIKRSGIDVVTLANNHILDFGIQGLSNTITILDSNNIKHIGAGKNRSFACAPTIVDFYGIKVGFLGFSMTYPKEFWAKKNSWGTCYPDEALLYRVISESEKNADLTVVSFHWGAEKRETPKDYQTFFARKAIDFGADLVLGHHPHVLQGLELYKNKLIAYSLGNYVFGSYSNNAKDSIVLEAELTLNGLLSAKVYPISVFNATVNFQPVLHKGKKLKAVLDHLNEISKDLNGNQNILSKSGKVIIQ
jgi:poly-gamma-glutamate capsule biosynthesis protein CapA/YwtB (metallophosphatase superfamily)